MNDDSILGTGFRQLGQTVKKAGQQIVKLPQEMAQDLGGQVGVVKPAASAKSDLASGPLRQSSIEASKPKQWQSDEERVKFLRGLYGFAQPSVETSASAKAASFAEVASATKAESEGKPEEQKKLMELRNQLHKENYYDPTFNPVKKQEERASEKVENEKKKEIQDLQQKEAKKPPPLAVVRERNKAEMFPGTSG